MNNITALTNSELNYDDVIVIAGAGGFIGGAFTKYLRNLGFINIRAIDKKPIPEWFQRIQGVQNICMDLSIKENTELAVKYASEVYNFAADMGGMGFIEKYRIECMRSVLINTYLLESSYKAGVKRYLFSSSACVYNANLQDRNNVAPLKESDAYPAMPERGYGWEKLFSEMMCQEYTAERGMKTFLPRYHNVYGPNGTWDGGREKAPAAICRKIIEGVDYNTGKIEIWGDGKQTRSFTYIDDAVLGIDLIMHSDKLTGVPINLGSSETVTINQLVDIVEDIAKVKLKREYNLSAPKGVNGRSSDNTFIRSVLNWEPNTPLKLGMGKTYDWILEEYIRRTNNEFFNSRSM